MNNRRALRPVWITLTVFAVILALVGAYLVWAANRQVATPKQDLQVLQPGDLRVSPTAIPTGQEVVGGDLAVTNSLRVAKDIIGASITITPSSDAPSAGQLYVTNDRTLHYYDGQSTTDLSKMGDIQKSTDALTQTVAQLQAQQAQTQAALAAAPQGVLSLQGQSGNIILTGGTGVGISGTTITNTGVTSLGGSVGGIGIGSGLEIVGNTLMNTKVTQIVSGSADITVIRDESGMYTISYTGSGQGGTVALGPTTAQQDTTNGSSIWINKTGVGNLLQLSTGTTPINRFVVDNSGAILTGTIGFNQITGLPSLVNTIAGRTGDLLLGSGLTVSGNTISSTAVVSVGGLTGAISLGSGLGVSGGQLVSTASGVGSITGTTNQITATGTGAVTLSLPQDIATSSTPTFGGLTLTTPLSIASGGTGANTAAAARTNLGAAKSGANNDITTLGAATSVGSTGQNLTLQGATTTLSSTGGGATTTLSFAAPTANVTYRLQAAVAGTYDVCTTVGNCAGVGGGVTTPGGTIGHLARYISGSAIGDSIISDNGSTVSIAGTLNVNNITPTAAAVIGATTQSLTLQGSNTSISSTNGVTTNTLQFTTPSGAAKSIVIPNASGTVAVAASGPIILGADGTLSCPSCLVSGGGGGNSGVSSVNGLSGGINVKSITASSIVTSGSDITIQDASTTVKGLASFNGTNFTVSSGAVNTVQDITVSATPTFGGMVLTGPNSLTLGSAVNAGSLLFKDGSSAFGSTFKANTLTADHSIIVPDASGTLAVSASGNIALSGSGDISFTGLLPVAQGGTGANTALGARAALGVAASGNNTDITALTGLTTALTIPQGGTGTNSLLQNGVLIGQGTAPMTSLVAGAAGQCLMSTAGTPVFQACPGSGGVVSVNGGMGAITLAGTSAGSVSTAGDAITINDATTSTKGLASFSAANFTVTGGMADTIQGIGPTSSPTFNALTLTTPLGVVNGGTGLNSVASNGQILIGNGSGYSLNTLTAGPGISILNTAGSISLSAPGSGNCASCALQSLSNLGAVAINVSLLPVSANLIDVGSAALPMRSGYFGSALQAASFDKSSAGSLDIGTTNATGINLNQNTVLAATKSFTITGGVTGTRPAAPTEGMMYYDNTTHTLLTWNGTKWMADKTNSTVVVAMGSPAGCTGTKPIASANPDGADYVVNSCTSAQTTINAAIAALPAIGGTVYLQEGTYIVDGTITLPKNVSLMGAGEATTLKLKDAINADINLISGVPVAGSRNQVTNLTLDGNKSNNTSGVQYGFGLTANMSSSTWLLNNVKATNFLSDGLYNGNIFILTVTSSTFSNNGGRGINSQGGALNISGSTMTGNTSDGVYVQFGSLYASNNYAYSNGGRGMTTYIAGAVNMTGNRVSSNATGGMRVGSQSTAAAVVSSNSIFNNTGAGLVIDQSDSLTITNNNISTNSGEAIITSYGTNKSVISDNVLYNNGGTSTANTIQISYSDASDTINGNSIITNATGAGIYLGAILATRTSVIGNNYSGPGTGILIGNYEGGVYLSGNTITGAATPISDSGAGTIYANQPDGKGNLINKGIGAVTIGTSSVNGTLSLQGGLTSVTLPAPTKPTITKTGVAGTNTYTYVVSALDGTGETLPSVAANITTGNATLNATNYNTITWGQVSGATSYKIYRTTSDGTPASTGLIATVQASAGTAAMGATSVTQALNDTGLVATTAVPTVNTTGGANFAGQIQGGSASLGGSLSVAGATGANYFNVDTSGNQVTIGTAAPTLPMAINDDYTVSAPTGTLRGSATYVAGSYVQFNTGANSNGQVEYTPAVTSTDFDSMFGMWSSGNDGNYLYAYSTATPVSFNQASGGYVFAVDAYNAQAAIYFNGTKLASTPLANAGDSTWHNVEARKVGTKLTMYRDGVLILTYNDISRTLTGTKFGVGGWGGGLGSGAHRAQNLKFQFGTTPMVSNVVNMVLNGAQTIQTATNSTTAFQVQNASAAPLLVADTTNMTVTIAGLAVTGATSLTGPLTVSGAATFSGGLTVTGATSVGNITVNGHIITSGTTPTIVAAAAACTTPTVAIAGTDTSGVITVTTGTGCAAPGALATINFATAFGAAPRITLTPATSTAAGLSTFIDDASLTTTSYTINTVNTPTNTTTYKWYYHALQ